MEEIGASIATSNVIPRQQHVFISHSEEDRAVALDIVRTLESDSFPCWIAPRNIDAGSSWMGAFVDAIVASQLMVVVVSKSSLVSQHVLREVTIADEERVPFLPFCIDNTPMSKDFRFFFSTAQRLQAGESVAMAIALLRRSVAKRLRPQHA
jgi:TIR domain